MGYHAPSAQEVYRYLFRLNRTETRLSDGFSWSILFMNDSSSLCRDFLVKYGAELCHRTGDRIRFVFFSDKPDSELEESADDAYQAGGFFSYIVDRVVKNWRGEPKYDLEREGFDALRPEALEPLDTQERISEHISFEAELYGAMPGSREVHRLAHTLGIGRFVPCFLLFADIGDPTVRLFPIAHKSPDEVCDRLRVWIDSFYEINQKTLAEWSTVEDSIKQTVARMNTSLREVANWKQARKGPWDELQTLSVYIDRMTNSGPDINLLVEFQNKPTISGETSSLVSPFSIRLQELAKEQMRVREVAQRLNPARSLSTPQLLRKELVRFEERYYWKTREPIRSYLSEAIRSCDPLEHPRSPREELYRWWRTEFGKPPSRNRYDKYRLGWTNYSKEKYVAAAVGNVSKTIKAEFDVIRRTALEQPVFKSAQDAAQAVINGLASYLDVSSDDREWSGSVSAYREMLTEYFTNLKQHAPSWLMGLALELSPQLRWEDCVPVEDVTIKPKHRKVLMERPPLQQLLERASSNSDLRIRQAETEQHQRVMQATGRLFTAIDESLASVKLLDADKAAIWSALLASLSSTRQKLENQIFKNAATVNGVSYPGENFSEVETRELLRLLDQYERAARSIRYPFNDDPEVLKVRLETSLIEASGIDDTLGTNVARELTTSLRDVAENLAKSVRDWESLQQEAQSWSPAGKLLTAMNKVLSRSSLDEAMKTIGAKNSAGTPGFLGRRDKIFSLLDGMPVQALVAVENELIGQQRRPDRGLAVTKQDLYDSIVLAIGLVPDKHKLNSPELADISPDKAEVLRDKVSRGIFDIFLAHNSRDHAEVSRLAHELRRQGINPWLDSEQIAPGRWFQDVIQSALRTVKSAAVIIGRSGIGNWQTVELRAALNRCIEQGVPLIPVLLPGINRIPVDLSFLGQLSQVQFKKDVTEPEGLSKLIWGITGKKL